MSVLGDFWMMVLPSQPSPGSPPAKNIVRNAPWPSARTWAPSFGPGVFALEFEIRVGVLRVGIDFHFRRVHRHCRRENRAGRQQSEHSAEKFHGRILSRKPRLAKALCHVIVQHPMSWSGRSRSRAPLASLPLVGGQHVALYCQGHHGHAGRVDQPAPLRLAIHGRVE